MADISLVIINDDAEEYCAALFKSIKEQVNPDELDIVFIDNCSKDNSVQKAKEFGIRKVFVSDIKQDHRGVLYRKGFSFTDRKNILFVHSDIVFGGDFFTELLSSIEAQLVGDFTSFSEYAPSMVYWGTNAIGIDNLKKTVFVRELFKEEPNDVEWLLQCSAACFMVHRPFMEKVLFSDQYRNSFVEHNLLLDVLNKDGRPAVVGDGCYVHYSIELHEKMKTYEDDLQIFLINLIKYYKLSADRIYEHLKRSNHQIANLNSQVNGFNNEINELNNQLRGLNNQVEDLALQLKEMPIALFFLKVRRKIKMKLNRDKQRKGL